MVSKWIFKTFYMKSIDPIGNGFVSILPTNYEAGYPLTNIIKWDDENAGKLTYVQKTDAIITLTFDKPISFRKYRMQVLRSNRYMKGWKIEASYDGVGFATIDSKEENFCFKNYSHDIFIDCGELTTRSFNVPITTAKVIKIIQTKPDSCGTYCIHLSGFDIFGERPEIICQNTNRMCRRSVTITYMITLLILFNS